MEVLCCLIDSMPSLNQPYADVFCFMVDDDLMIETTILDIPVIPFSSFDPALYSVVVAIGDPQRRKAFVHQMPETTDYITVIHPSAVVSKWVTIGEGSIITAGAVLTYNIRLGRHSQVNLLSTIGHDCQMGDYFTTAPSVNISGNCKAGESVYFGTNSCIREGVTICANVTIGMGSVVLNDISEAGVYVGNPLKKLN